MMTDEIIKQSQSLHKILCEKGLTISVAESCTGGMLSSALTCNGGASQYFLQGLITYSNTSKNALLNVPLSLIERDGAVSPKVAHQMALGCLEKSHSHISISITGIAGPSASGSDKPIGLVYMCVMNCDHECMEIKELFSGNRQDIQQQTTQSALFHIENFIHKYHIKP